MSKPELHRRIRFASPLGRRWRVRGHGSLGHLLSEFLVSLGLLFLLLAANLGILSSSAGWAREAAHSRNATSLARDGIESVMAASTEGEEPVPERVFALPGSRPGSVVLYHRRVELLPLDQGHEGVQLARVTVSWDEGSAPVVLERYVRDR